MPKVQINGDKQVSSADIPNILATIRHNESNNNYTIKSKSSTASGAYQMIDSTWRSWSQFVIGAANYAHASDAPPAVQDAVAGAAVQRILNSHGNWLSSVPINWYLPSAWENPAIANQVPAGGNTMTVAAYAQRWVNYFLGGKAPTANPPGGVGSGGGGGSSGPSGGNDPSNAGMKLSDVKPPPDPTGGVPFMVGTKYAYQISTGDPMYTDNSDPNSNDDVYTVVGGKRVGTPAIKLSPPILSNPLTSILDFLNVLVNPGTWIRVVKVVGGVITIIIGLVILGKQMGAPIPKLSTLAAV